MEDIGVVAAKKVQDRKGNGWSETTRNDMVVRRERILTCAAHINAVLSANKRSGQISTRIPVEIVDHACCESTGDQYMPAKSYHHEHD